MPLYEYECVEDGEVIELLRPMRDADAKVEDPKQQGRNFTRRHSVFGVNGAPAGSGASGHVHSGGCCPCGKPASGCGRNN
ncbi:MAG: zinc ribbon domain-containing protein [Planctomycetota bacterium]|nr:zinc ribbon domain-containing protein [Planctomycetota bacterium]